MDVAPDKQNLDQVFAHTTYYIDFYQRDYKWKAEPVERLLKDEKWEKWGHIPTVLFRFVVARTLPLYASWTTRLLRP